LPAHLKEKSKTDTSYRSKVKMVNLEKYDFDCGCQFDILDSKIKESDGLPSLDIDYYNIPLDCSKTWEMFGSGFNKGLFQFESQLGKTWIKRAQPGNIEDIAALNALLRPGALKGIIDGKSTTQRWVDVKTGKEKQKVIHPALEEILQTTYGCLVFQEQSLSIARKLAGFSLEQADILRRAIGKKKADLMTEVEQAFIKGCREVGLANEEAAKQIFDLIRKGERYSFNASHAVSYGLISYWSAYAKAHFPLHFFTSYLEFSQYRAKHDDELPELISETRQFGLPVIIPTLADKLHTIYTLQDQKIKIGLNHISGIGNSVFNNIEKVILKAESDLKKPLKHFTWFETLTRVLSNIKKDAVNNLIGIGCLSFHKIQRKYMLYEYNVWQQLSEREQKFIIDSNAPTLIDGLEIVRENVNRKRLQTIESLISIIESPIQNVEDSEEWIIKQEKDVLGVEITNVLPSSMSSGLNCKDLANIENMKNLKISCKISRATQYKVKNGKSKGQDMCFLSIEDNDGSFDNVVVFSDKYAECKNLLYKDSFVELVGYVKNNSFIVNKATWIK
jgi:DNA polymerase-3 subunit alpha